MLLTEQTAGLPATGQRGSQAGNELDGERESKTKSLSLRTRRRVGQPALVVLEQKPPGARVVLHDVEHCGALAADKLVTRQGAGKQADGLLDLAEALLAQTPLVE